MNTAVAMGTSVRLSCARCSSSHRVRDVYALKSGMKACRAHCGAPFLVVGWQSRHRMKRPLPESFMRLSGKAR